jgi:hypothetical protein
MDINLSEGIAPQPYDVTQSLAYGQPGTVNQQYSIPAGEYYTKANADLRPRTLETNETGTDVSITTGLQSAFSPSLAGAAETRTVATSYQLPSGYYYVQ